MPQDLVVLTAWEMPTASKDCASAAGVHDASDDNHKILATDVDRTVKAQTEKNEIQLVLPSEEFKQSDLSSYLRSYLEAGLRPSATEQLLGPLAIIDPIMIETTIETELQEISKGKLINKIMGFDSNGDKLSEVSTKSAQRLWSALKSTNVANVNSEKIVFARRDGRVFGKVVQIQSLTPITTLQLLVSLGLHFDIERILSTFLRQGPSICYHPNLTISTGDSWFFCMKYYYLSSGEPESYLGQTSGIFHEKKKGIYICRGSSSVALHFEDNGNEDHVPIVATPWRLLINSCDQQAPQPLPSLLSGVQAYLWGVNHELTGVRRALRNMSNQISSISVPSDDFLFDSKLRESVLFEDESYTNSRTYFWALQSLRIVNDCINSIITAWEMSNTSHILRAVQPWPGLTERENSDLGPTRTYLAAIETQLEQLKGLIKENSAKQEEIIALRDGLFNASAVLEARTTVTQGENIRILTYISMLFLPASFSTSIFGMQSILPTSTKIYTFAIVIIAVCGPTYLLIWFLSWKRGKGWIERMKKKAKLAYGTEKVGSDQRGWLGRRKRKTGDIEKGD